MKRNEYANLIYGNVLTDNFSRKRFESILAIIGKRLKDNMKVLDIGCYTADILEYLPFSLKYHGIDNDKKALEIAKKRGAIIHFCDVDTKKISIKKYKFDLIIATEILEHLKDPESMLRQMQVLLKHNGFIVVSLPNECTIYHRIKIIFGKGIDGTGFAPHYHMHFPTLKQNKELLLKYFEIVDLKYWVHADIGGILGKITKKIPYIFLMFLAKILPTLFARGAIYLCKKKDK